MKAPADQSESSQLWRRAGTLAADPLQVLRLKALLVPHPPRGQFLQCLQATRLRTAGGKGWTNETLNPILESLKRQGLLSADLACVPALQHRMTLDALASPDADALLSGIAKTLPPDRYGFLDLATVARTIRLQIYANDAAAFTASLALLRQGSAGRPEALFMEVFGGETLEPDWLDSRHEPIRMALVQAQVLRHLLTGLALPDLPAMIARAQPLRGLPQGGALHHLLILHDIVTLRLDSAQAALPKLADSVGIARQALHAGIVFLRGANAEALEDFRQALKLLRKHLGRRKIFFDDLTGILFLMALLRARDPAGHKEMQAGLDVFIAPTQTYGQPVSPYAPAALALQALLWLEQGKEDDARKLVKQLRTAMPAEPLSAACVGVAEFALDAELTAARRRDHRARFDALRESMPLVARIHAEILGDDGYLAETGGDTIVSISRLIETRPAWARALDTLDAFLGAPAKAAGERPAGPSKRLAWFVDPDTGEVELAEQSARGRDGWTDGRPVALKRLREGDPRIDYLTEQDRAALRFIRREAGDWYNSESHYLDSDGALPALVGHPCVFHAQKRSLPIELVAYPLELVVRETAEGYNLALSHSAESGRVFLEAETPTRFRVIVFPAKLLDLQRILGKKGLSVPRAGRDQVIAMAKRANPTLAVRAEIAEIEQPGQAGNAAAVVQAAPLGEGLVLRLMVRPFGPQGPAFVAGLGARSVLAEIDGNRLRATRDLDAELAARKALIAACPSLRDVLGATAHEAAIEEPETCLEILLELHQAGATLEWPEGARMHVSAAGSEKVTVRVSQDRDWFKLDGSITVDDGAVLEMRFLLDRLDKAQGRFIPLGDGRFVALTRQLQGQLQRLNAVAEPHRNTTRVHALGVAALDGTLGELGSVKTDAAWKRQVARIASAEGWTPKLPSTLQAELRDYQLDGFVWLSRLARWGAGACLADDMGLGKTVQAIAVLLDRAQDGPCIVVAPTSVCPNWEAEIARFAPTLTAHRLAAAPDRAALVGSLGVRDILVCSYGLLHQEAELLGAVSWQMAVLDEAQAIKNAGTKRAQASLSLKADFRLALTGTPVENYLDELWSLFNFVNPGLLGAREAFQKRFAGPIERDRNPQARAALRALIRPFLLRRTKANVLSELPPRTEQTITVEMSQAEQAFYEALRQKALDAIAALEDAKGPRKIHILAEITRLRRACCNPALIDAGAGVASSKLEAFLELVDELIRNRHKALVFSQFTGHLALVRAALDARKISYQYLDGATPMAERERAVAAFQAGGSDLFLISLRAGGTGLNLTAADYVVHLDPWWNPAVEDQASDRAHRIGQERPVTIYRLVMQGSIEERILRLHADKRDLAADLLEGTDSNARMSEEELLDLIRL